MQLVFGAHFGRFLGFLVNFLMKIKNQNLMIPPLDKVFRKQLIDIYHDDILQLGNLLNRDLSHWLEM